MNGWRCADGGSALFSVHLKFVLQLWLDVKWEPQGHLWAQCEDRRCPAFQSTGHGACMEVSFHHVDPGI